MKMLRDIPLKRKLTLITMATSCTVLLLASLAFFIYERVAYRQALVNSLLSMAKMVGDNSVSALAFNDPASAELTMKSLSADSHIVAGAVYDKRGKAFAKYQPAGVERAFAPPPVEPDGHRFGGNRLRLFRRISLAGEPVGVVYLESDLEELQRRLGLQALVGLAVLLAAGLLAYGLSSRMQRIISEPVFHLARTAATVATGKDYSIRAVKQGDDEFGRLIDGFNEMLGQIQGRDRALQDAKDHLELRVAERTKELKQSESALLNMMDDTARSRERVEQAYEELKREVAERKKMEAQFLQSQKLEAIGQLAGGVAHDFNNLLVIIQGYTQMAMERETLDAEVKEELRQVFMAGERAAGLTSQLLAFSRKQVMNSRVLDLNRVVADVAKMLHRIIGEHIELTLECAPGLPPIQADTGMLEQVLMNLAVNARDAMPQGGRLVIDTGLATVDAVQVARQAQARAGEFVRLRVRDDGCGMTPEIMARVFEPFFTTKDVGKGSGLGLATVYGIVSQHQGWVEVESQIGRGTTFKVFLPALAATAQIVEDPPATHKAHGGSETILVVEDEPSVRELSVIVLEKAGYRVLQAASGDEALAVWKRHGPRISLLLTDIVMPGDLSGWELAQLLLDVQPALKVIYTSGYNEEMAGQVVATIKEVNFIQKPYQPSKLTRAVRQALDGKPSP